MFYRVTMQLAFFKQDEAKDFYHDGEVAMPKSKVINPGQPNEEKGYIRLEKCYHDQDPVLACQILAFQQGA